jgi:hypothetical protein
MAVNGALPDYYAVLQVHPEAEHEVIEAAYRQLMKKHHPDVAGDDPSRVAAHHERSKSINEAFRVLRDPIQRRHYHELRSRDFRYRAADRGASGPRPAPADTRGPAPRPQPAPPPAPVEIPTEDGSAHRSPWLAPFRLLADLYYLLPGQYEWENGRRTELLSIALVPLAGTAGFCLVTGRLSQWIGDSISATLVAWVLLGLAVLPLWQALPRVALAAVPSLALLSGSLAPLLSQAHVPLWLAWPILGFLSLLLSARIYVFSVLPTLGVCWLVVRATER